MLYCQGKTPKEIFQQYDYNSDGYLDHVEQWRMLKVGGAVQYAVRSTHACLYLHCCYP